MGEFVKWKFRLTSLFHRKKSVPIGSMISRRNESYQDLGKFWGKNLKTGPATPEQLVAFLRSDMLQASDTSRAFFRGGFLKSYKEGAAVLDRAMNERQSTAPVKP